MHDTFFLEGRGAAALVLINTRETRDLSKKTEKIEIRVTPEEKDGLMDLARSEGRSVSELIRSIVGAYMQAKTAGTPMSKHRINQMAKSPKSWSIATVFTLILGAFVIAAPAQAEKPYTVHVEIKDKPRGSFVLSSTKTHTIVATTTAESESFVDLLSPENIAANRPEYKDWLDQRTTERNSEYKIRLRVQELGDGTTFAEFQICKNSDPDCELVAEPSLQFVSAEGGRIEIGSSILDPETGTETPYELITILSLIHI